MIDYYQSVSVSDRAVKLFKRANGAIVKRVYVPSGGAACTRVAWEAPRWADAAYAQCGLYKHSNKLARVLRRAHRDVNVRDALIAAIEARLVTEFVMMQDRRS